MHVWFIAWKWPSWSASNRDGFDFRYLVHAIPTRSSFVSIVSQSRGLTEDFGVARVDERLVNVVTRSYRCLAPVTRHSIMLRSQRDSSSPDRPDGRVNYRTPSRETRVKRPHARASGRCIFMGCPRCHKQRPSNDGNILRCKDWNYLTFILSLARWPGSSSSSRLDIVEYSPCCSNTISESGFTWKKKTIVRCATFLVVIESNCIESNFPISASEKDEWHSSRRFHRAWNYRFTLLQAWSMNGEGYNCVHKIKS